MPIENRNLEPGTKLVAHYKKETYHALVVPAPRERCSTSSHLTMAESSRALLPWEVRSLARPATAGPSGRWIPAIPRQMERMLPPRRRTKRPPQESRNRQPDHQSSPGSRSQRSPSMCRWRRTWQSRQPSASAGCPTSEVWTTVWSGSTATIAKRASPPHWASGRTPAPRATSPANRPTAAPSTQAGSPLREPAPL